MKYLVIIFLLFIFLLSCNESSSNGALIPLSKPFIILDKRIVGTEGGDIYFIYIYVDRLIRIGVNRETYLNYKISDTVKNVALIITE